MSSHLNPRIARLITGVSLSLILAMGVAPTAWAATPSTADKKKAEAAAEVERLKKELPGLQKDLKKATDKRDDQKKEIDAAAADAKASVEALNAARAASTEARGNEAAVISGLRKKSESDPAVAAASAALKDAQDKFKAASDKAVGPLANTEAYKAAQAEVDDATASMKKLQENPDNDSPAERARLAQAMVAAQKKLGSMRDEAIAADPAAAAARAKLTEAEAAMADVNRKIDEANKSDPARLEAHKHAEETANAMHEAEAANAKSQGKLSAARAAARATDMEYQKASKLVEQTKNMILANGGKP